MGAVVKVLFLFLWVMGLIDEGYEEGSFEDERRRG